MFDSIECDYPLPDPRHQDLEFQTKDFDCVLAHYTITRDGRLIEHARRWVPGESGGGRLVRYQDVEVPFHGETLMCDLDPEVEHGLIEYRVRFTHGRVEWIRRVRTEEGEPQVEHPPAEAAPPPTPIMPDVLGRGITVEEFQAHTPEKLELLGGRIPGDKKLLLLLLTSFGLRRTAALVGREAWLRAVAEETEP